MERNTKIIIAGSAVAVGLAAALYWYYFIREEEQPPIINRNGNVIKPSKKDLVSGGPCTTYEDCPVTEECVNGKCTPLPQYSVPKPPEKPNAPTDLKVAVVLDQPIKLSWTAPVQNEAKITGYRIYRIMDYGYYKETESYGILGTKTAWDDTLRKGKVGVPANTITYQVSAVAQYKNILKEEPETLEGAKSNAVTVTPIPPTPKEMFGQIKVVVKNNAPGNYPEPFIRIEGAGVTISNITKRTDSKGEVLFDKLSFPKSGRIEITVFYNGQMDKKSIAFDSSDLKMVTFEENWELIKPKEPEKPIPIVNVVPFNPFAGVIQPINPNPIINVNT